MTETNLIRGWTWEDVVCRLGEHVDLEESARAKGAIKRTRTIKTAEQLLRLVLAYVLSGLSFRGTAAWAEATGHASLSDVALLKRLRGCKDWLGELVSRMAAVTCAEASCAGEGRRVVAVDATAVCSPGDKRDYQLLHVVYDVTLQRFVGTELTDRHVAERLDLGGIEPGEIRLGDRVYGRFRDLSAVQAASADYVVRLGAKALKLLTQGGRKFKRAAICRRAEAQGAQDVPVLICDTESNQQIRARLIVLPLPPEQAEAARRGMRKNACKWGYTPSDDALATAGCVMLITSLPLTEWPAMRVLDLYRRRWQLELAFKRLKSLIGLEDLRVHDSDLVSVWIHAVLLAALVIEIERPSTEIERPDSLRWATNLAGQFRSGASSASCLRPDPRGPCRPQIRSNSRLQNPRTARRAPTPTMYASKPRLARMGLDPATHAMPAQAESSHGCAGRARA